MSYIMNTNELQDRLQNKQEETAIIDVRFNMAEVNAGKEAYMEGHIPTAIYMDLDKDFSGPKEQHGGNHPLPNMNTFAQKLGDNGIDNEKTVVIYDQGNGMFAARAWWVIHYAGHEDVYVLDGGFDAWERAGNPVTKEIIKPAPTRFKLRLLDNATADINEVKARKDESSVLLIDSRSKDRYLGKDENMHQKAGHIPGAKNFFWKEVLDENGNWKDTEALKEQFSSISKDDEIIVSCGSGISACPNILGLKMAGYENIKLYPGSFSDWISYEENPLETEEE